MKDRFVILPTGALIDLENIGVILGTNLNTEFVIVPKVAAAPQAPKLSLAEFEEFYNQLEMRGYAFRVPKPSEKPIVAA